MTINSLDNGFRSKCCYAPIRIGFKTIKKTKIRTKIWVCTRCKDRDVDIIPREHIKSQPLNDVTFEPNSDE